MGIIYSAVARKVQEDTNLDFRRDKRVANWASARELAMQVGSKGTAVSRNVCACAQRSLTDANTHSILLNRMKQPVPLMDEIQNDAITARQIFSL